MNIGFYSWYEVMNNNTCIASSSVPGGGPDTNYSGFLLAQKLRNMGHKISTIDTGKLEDYDKIIFSEFPSRGKSGTPNKYLRKLIKNGFSDMYLICLEPPAILPHNWIIKNHKYFKKIFTWHDDYVDGKRYVRVYSNSCRKDENFEFDFSARTKLCALIARNKFSKHPAELYSERRKAIRWFERNHPEDFDLYGGGWDKPLFTGPLRFFNIIDNRLKSFSDKIPYPKLRDLLYKISRTSYLVYFLFHGNSIQYPSYNGSIGSVKDALRKYKFVICFENSSFPGWVTERMFQCFIAGCIPIYLGDPNITARIPEEAFIDMRKFKSYDELYDYIANLSSEEYMKYIEAIKDFMSGDKAYPFTAEYFAQTVIDNIFGGYK